MGQQEPEPFEWTEGTVVNGYQVVAGAWDRLDLFDPACVRFGDYREVLGSAVDPRLDVSGQVDLILTSPPYNVGSKGARNDGRRKDGGYDPKSYGAVREYFDDYPEPEYQKMQIDFLRWCADALTDEGVLVYNHKNRRRNYTTVSPWQWLLEVTDVLRVTEEIIWDRGSTHNHDKSQLWAQTERLFVLTRPSYKYPLDNRKTGRDMPQRSDVWRINNHHVRKAGVDHNVPFAPELVQAVIATWSEPGDLVCDPYAGSGTALVEAVKLGRRAVGAEIVPRYWAMADARLTEAKTQSSEEKSA